MNRGGRGAAYSAGYHHGRHDRRYDYWKDARRDWMRYRTINNAMVLGTYALTRPRYSTTVVVSGTPYYYYGGTYYVSSGSKYVVVAPPPGAVVYAVPAPTTVVYEGSNSYYYYNGTYYQPTDKEADRPEGAAPPPPPPGEGEDPTYSVQGEEGEDGPEMIESDHNYEVIQAPIGATVPYLPEEAKEVDVAGKKYHVFDDTYYQTFVSDGDTIYMVVADPTGGDDQ
ncbi:MAG: DUF6515 family protein, partial [Planctomycetota bacterium]